MTNAKRGPSYLRFGGSARPGRVEMPTIVEAEQPPAAAATEDVLQRQLQSWEAPVLSDEEIEVYAKIFLMNPGHELMPFFLWMDAARIQAQWRPRSNIAS